MSKFLKYLGFLTALYCAVMFYITADSEKNPELFYGILFLILIPFDRITHFEYKGHKYVKFEEIRGYGSVGGVVHDPDCWCSKIKDKNEYRTVN